MEWMIKCRSKPGTAERREQTIAAHRNYLDNFKKETWFSGPMIADDGETANGSFRLIDFPARADARKYIDEDPYSLAELFDSVDIVRWRPSTSVRQRDYAQRHGFIQFVAVGRLDGGADIHAAFDRFAADHADALVAGGPLLDNDGGVTGTLCLLDVLSREAAEKVLSADPCAQDYAARTLERWRFGHV